ncbi:uncharacterized protein LOC110032195 isoform X2 [Phalaenopsis equestris]|uniref:uncharacterized protein LOC110032195 isoform X2 n=1 Tax=Phalaenopsis equestris TaxID=78828 RepID=UPI0009E28601|nr:uncharacterized protein LOC110032195 isoform X2 [Phalaenopsis equestris]
MEKVSSDGDGEHDASGRGLSRSKTNFRFRVSPASSDDSAKTSELKSFKRLLEKTTEKHYFDEVAKSDIKLKKGKTTDFMEGDFNADSQRFRFGQSFRRASSAIQNVSSTVQGFLSSPTLVLQKQSLKNKAEGNNGAGRSVPISKITHVDRLFHPSPLTVGKNCVCGHSGTMQEHEGTFSEKRAFLLQLAAGTSLQNIDEFFSNRSDFLLEILRRLGIRRDANIHEKLQNPEQKMSSQFPVSFKRSNQIANFCENPQEDFCVNKIEQYDNLLELKWDDTEIQALPYNNSPITKFKIEHWMPDLSTEKTLPLLCNFKNPASAIELIKEFDFSEYRYTDESQALLSPPCDISEFNVFLAHNASYMGQLCKSLNCNSVLNHKEMFDLSVAEDSDTSFNSNVELNSSSHGFLRRNHDSFQADYILPDIYNSDSLLQQQALSEEQFIFPLLEWDAAAEQEMSTPICLVSKELDQITESPLYDTFDFHDDIGSFELF